MSVFIGLFTSLRLYLVCFVEVDMLLAESMWQFFMHAKKKLVYHSTYWVTLTYKKIIFNSFFSCFSVGISFMSNCDIKWNKSATFSVISVFLYNHMSLLLMRRDFHKFFSLFFLPSTLNSTQYFIFCVVKRISFDLW